MKMVTILFIWYAASAWAQAPTSPCAVKPEYRQLDFWLGSWIVLDQGKPIAETRIERAIGDCAISEDYRQGDGFAGRSVNFYDAALGQWRQTWVDIFGNVSEFTASFRDGAMHFQGETHRANGEKVLRRMVLTPEPEGVHHFSERSSDGGKIWQVAYDYHYRRKP